MSLNFMLIDDSSIELFASQKCIEKEVVDSETITFIRAKMALAYLQSLSNLDSEDNDFIPDIILVDLHMPEMDGFEFLKAVEDLYGGFLSKTRIYMLSSSLNINEINDARAHLACDGYIHKPLTLEKVQQLRMKQFQPLEQTN
ncbi:response regulator [Robiginitalea sp. IMCC43444]|uniref:response regulator n=1 Tax=Robiginitalea sp. IMCC43444 TaxID=3459121 RepID=UPI0040426806